VSEPRRACYGIAEIADALGVGRQLVAAWRRRRSHGMPEPDEELASGPVWLGRTIEPWIDQLPARPTGPEPVNQAEVHRIARRLLRLLALLLEDPPRAALVARAVAEVREVADGDDRDPVRAGLLRLLAPVTGADRDPEPAELRRRLLAGLPALAELVLSFDGGGRVRTVAG
jgi:transcriptional regulator with XRE-family HTH domain